MHKSLNYNIQAFMHLVKQLFYPEFPQPGANKLFVPLVM